MVTERAGPAIGALISTCPFRWAGFRLLALDHDAAFVAEGSTASLAINAATAIYALVYCVVAQRHGFSPALPSQSRRGWRSLSSSTACDGRSSAPSRPMSCALHWASRSAGDFRHARMPLVTPRWYDTRYVPRWSPRSSPPSLRFQAASADGERRHRDRPGRVHEPDPDLASRIGGPRPPP